MARIVKNGISYSQDASALTTGSNTMTQSSGILEASSIYQRGDSSTGNAIAGVFKIFSGTGDPRATLGQNGDIYLKKITT